MRPRKLHSGANCYRAWRGSTWPELRTGQLLQRSSNARSYRFLQSDDPSGLEVDEHPYTGRQALQKPQHGPSQQGSCGLYLQSTPL